MRGAGCGGKPGTQNAGRRRKPPTGRLSDGAKRQNQKLIFHRVHSTALPRPHHRVAQGETNSGERAIIVNPEPAPEPESEPEYPVIPGIAPASHGILSRRPKAKTEALAKVEDSQGNSWILDFGPWINDSGRLFERYYGHGNLAYPGGRIVENNKEWHSLTRGNACVAQ